MVNRILRFLFWVCATYILFSFVGIIAIVIFRPDIKVIETVPFIISVLVGSASAYILGGIIYDGKEKKE